MVNISMLRLIRCVCVGEYKQRTTNIEFLSENGKILTQQAIARK